MAIIKKYQNILKFKSPASLWGAMWREGLPTGNGNIGASVLGGAGFDTVTINHADLWWHGRTGVLPDVSLKLKNAKTSLQNGSYVEAQNMLSNALIAKGYRPQLSSPLPLCDLLVETEIEKGVKDYTRMLNMENGEVSVEFKDKNTRYERSLFVSRANDTVFMQMTKSGSKQISCKLKLDLHDKFYNRTPSAIAEVPTNYESKAEKGYLYFNCRNDNGTDFGAVARVQLTNGTFTANEDGSCTIKNADKVFISIKVYVESQRDKEFAALKDALSMNKLTYEKFLKEHTSIHSKLFNACSMSLSAPDVEYVDEIVQKAKYGEVSNSLFEKLYSFGRYLFICSAPQNELGANPYGLFNGDYRAHQSTRNNYIQTQMLYNFALGGNIPQLVLPVLKQYYNNIDDYKKNATRLFNCRGIYIPAYEAPESGLLGSVEPSVVLNFNVAAYVCQMFYEYYLHTEDVKFLKEYAVEMFTETGYFYEDLLKINKTTKVFESLIGYAPNTPKNCVNAKDEPVCVASNCAADFACARQVFSILSEIGTVAGLSKEDIEKWADLASKVPDYEVDESGIIKEYNSNVFETNENMPNVPHIFPYNVGSVGVAARKDFEKMIDATCKTRFANCKGAFTSENLLALAVGLSTTGAAAGSYEILQTLAQNFLTKNLVFANTDWTGMGVSKNDRWATYSITNNTGLCLAMQNIFANSNKSSVSLFRNLPHEINKASITGLMLDNQMRVDMDINRRRGVIKLKLKSAKSNQIKICLPDGTRKVKGVELTQVDLENLVVKDINMQAGKTLSLKISWSNKI